MPLTKEQKAKLLEELGPVIQEALAEGVTPIVQEEVSKVLREAREDSREYSAMILSARDRERIAEIESDPKKAGIGVARIARCMALAKNDVEQAAHLAKSFYQDDLGSAVEKVLSSGDTDEGGVFVPSELADTFIDALRAVAVVRQAGPVEIDLSGGNLRIPRVTTDPTASYIGEGQNRNASNLRTGSLNFTSKQLQGKSAVTQQLLRRSGQNAEQIVRDGLVRVMSNREDIAFLSGAGTEHEPRGMLHWAVDSNVFNATQAGAAATLDEVQDDLRKAISNLTDNDVSIANAHWFKTWRSRNYLAYQLRDTEDRPAFKEELTAATPMLNGLRCWTTNNIPNNLGSGNDESRIYLAAMDQAWLAEESGLRVRASTEASYLDEDGNLISAFDQGLMVLIIEREHDFAMAHGEAVSVIEQVKWGA